LACLSTLLTKITVETTQALRLCQAGGGASWHHRFHWDCATPHLCATCRQGEA